MQIAEIHLHTAVNNWHFFLFSLLTFFDNCRAWWTAKLCNTWKHFRIFVLTFSFRLLNCYCKGTFCRIGIIFTGILAVELCGKHCRRCWFAPPMAPDFAVVDKLSDCIILFAFEGTVCLFVRLSICHSYASLWISVTRFLSTHTDSFTILCRLSCSAAFLSPLIGVINCLLAGRPSVPMLLLLLVVFIFFFSRVAPLTDNFHFRVLQCILVLLLFYCVWQQCWWWWK